MELKRQLGLASAILIIIADIIGTGIFVTTGSVLGMTGNSAIVLCLWIVGGLVAVTGALCYAELATMWPDDGGEYIYLKKIYGYLPSFLTGWVSLTVGFTASVAITALTLVWYLNEFWSGGILASSLAQKTAASIFIVFFGLLHILGVKRGGFVQNALTIIKLAIVFSLIIFGFAYIDWSLTSRLTYTAAANESVGLGTYGLSLLIIMFAYSGWNGVSYIAGEIKNPQKNLPRSMFFGTLAVVIIYALLNIVFIMSSPSEQISGSHIVAAIASANLFGNTAASLLILGIALVLVSSVSVQMMVGPRVYYAMAKDKLTFAKLANVHPTFGTPYLAILVQMIIALIYIFIGKDHIEMLLVYMGFSLGIFPLMAVIGLVIMRFKAPEIERPFKVPLFPLVPAIYILLTIGMMVASLIMWTETSLTALGVLSVGVVIYYIWRHFTKEKN